MGSCGVLGAETTVPFTERVAVTTYETERDSPRRGDAATVLGGEMGKRVKPRDGVWGPVRKG